jgi:phenylalanyl-tRNA synthetase beta chain
MTISYNWLHEYLPVTVEPERLSIILTSIGLEVESFGQYESIKGGLQGLVIGEVLTAEKHPNADKLSVTTVNIGHGCRSFAAHPMWLPVRKWWWLPWEAPYIPATASP